MHLKYCLLTFLFLTGCSHTGMQRPTDHPSVTLWATMEVMNEREGGSFVDVELINSGTESVTLNTSVWGSWLWKSNVENASIVGFIRHPAAGHESGEIYRRLPPSGGKDRAGFRFAAPLYFGDEVARLSAGTFEITFFVTVHDCATHRDVPLEVKQAVMIQ